MTPRQEFELEELARIMFDAKDDDDIDAVIDEHLGVSWFDFIAVAGALIPYTVKAKIATLDAHEECAQGFVHDGAFIVKRVVDCSA
jgi:hypothetical protein